MEYRISHLVTASLGTRTTVQVDEKATVLDENLEIDFFQGTFQFTRINNGIYTQGKLATQVHLTCMRCLEPFTFALNFEIAERYLFSSPKDEEEQVYVMDSDGTIDITEPVRQQLWVSLPIQPLCKPDCRGFCAQCGANLNQETCTCQEETIDPRFAILKELK